MLLSNLAAVRAVCGAVEGTYGPRGLDCLLVDERGGMVLTNDGVTILRYLAVTHPAARLLVEAAKAQERAVGDGTTTAVILAGALIGEGVSQILRGVPVTRVIGGIKMGIGQALSTLRAFRRPVAGLGDPVAADVALVAGRGDAGLARTVLAAAEIVGAGRLNDETFNLAESVLGLEGVADEAFSGLAIEREPVVPEIVRSLHDVKVLVIEGSLEPEPLPHEALASAAGLAKADAQLNEFHEKLALLVDSGVGLIVASRGIPDSAAQFLADRGVLVLRRVPERDLRRAAVLTGARLLRHAAGQRSGLAGALGQARSVEYDAQSRLVRIVNGREAKETTILVGGGTAEAVAERERIAKDAASAVQQAIKGGVVPGGGAAELALSLSLDRYKAGMMSAYGIACVREALRRPLAQLAANAGFNPLEKLEEVWAAQERSGRPGLGIDAETGAVTDQAENGIWDPFPVKEHALRIAGEVCTAVLRIGSILKMRSEDGCEEGWHDPG